MCTTAARAAESAARWTRLASVYQPTDIDGEGGEHHEGDEEERGARKHIARLTVSDAILDHLVSSIHIQLCS
jgi:hypothetical protein